MRALLFLLALSLVGCGTDRFQRSQSGDRFPGSEPLVKYDAEPDRSNALGIQSVVLTDPAGPADEPFLLERSDERLLYYAAIDGGIRVASAAPGTLAWSAPTTVLTPVAAWEGARVTAPTLREEDGRIVLWYAGGDGAGIGRAESPDGRVFARLPAGPVLEPALGWEGGEVGSPSVARAPDGSWWMAYAGGAGVGLARSDDGIEWTRVDGDDGRAGLDPALGPGAPGEWDAAAVRAPSLTVERSELGRVVFRILYEGEGRVDALIGSPPDASLGRAASFGPGRWVRFEGNPVLAEAPPLALGAGVDERAPAELRIGDTRCVLFATRGGPGAAAGIGLAADGPGCDSR